MLVSTAIEVRSYIKWDSKKKSIKWYHLTTIRTGAKEKTEGKQQQ